LPLVKEEGDIVEQQKRKTQQVVESLTDLSFIPSQFLGKELLRKRREARKQPLIPSLPVSILLKILFFVKASQCPETRRKHSE